jgi:hypothetical protein
VKKDQGSERPVLINMTEASSLLGYKSAQVVKKLVNEGFLKRFKLPDSKRSYVDRNEVESLIRPIERDDTPKGF